MDIQELTQIYSEHQAEILDTCMLRQGNLSPPLASSKNPADMKVTTGKFHLPTTYSFIVVGCQFFQELCNRKWTDPTIFSEQCHVNRHSVTLKDY